MIVDVLTIGSGKVVAVADPGSPHAAFRLKSL